MRHAQSRFGKLLHGRLDLWDSSCPLWPSLLSAMRDLADRIELWRPVPGAPPPYQVELWTDASTYGWGALVRGVFADADAWDPSETQEPIHRLEANAAAHGVDRLIPHLTRPTHILNRCDNTICVFAYEKGASKDPLTASILRGAKRDAAHHGHHLSLTHVRTDQQLADGLSRGKC